MRTVWKGHIRFSLVTIPIRIFNAVDSSETIRFNQLHKEDNGPIGYDKYCKKCSEKVSNKEIVKGYEFEPEQFVIVEPEDFEKVKLKSTKVIEIAGFVDAEEVHPTLYDTPYYAGPDGDIASKTYSLLAQALRSTGKLGIGKVVLRDREEIMMVGPHENGIILYKLRYPQNLKGFSEVPDISDAEPEDAQLGLAKDLIESMATSLEDIDLKDQYQDALREVIEAKVEGKEVVTIAEEERPVIDIMSALKESIEQAKTTRQPMKKAEAPAKKVTKKASEAKKKVA